MVKCRPVENQKHTLPSQVSLRLNVLNVLFVDLVAHFLTSKPRAGFFLEEGGLVRYDPIIFLSVTEKRHLQPVSADD